MQGKIHKYQCSGQLQYNCGHYYWSLIHFVFVEVVVLWCKEFVCCTLACVYV